MTFNQGNFDVRCEWGAEGVAQLAAGSDALIIVDVLSFSTCVSIAVDHGAWVYPFAGSMAEAQAFAAQQGALLATKDRRAPGYTLSPSSLMGIPAETRLVLPSPNGSRLSTLCGATPAFAGCLRNARAVARAAQRLGRRVSVIPAGERWRPEDALRPALEDWLGAGAIIHHLSGAKSLEAQAAEALFLTFHERLHDCLTQIGSGRELIEQGFSNDVRLAAELDVSAAAPRLVAGAYRMGE
jgi:2-phosphosulfolactate phosphatase